MDGLNLSRAWMLGGITAGLPKRDNRLPSKGAAIAHRQAGLAAMTGEHYEGGHWLGSFAVYLVTKRGGLAGPRPNQHPVGQQPLSTLDEADAKDAIIGTQESAMVAHPYSLPISLRIRADAQEVLNRFCRWPVSEQDDVCDAHPPLCGGDLRDRNLPGHV